MKITYITFAPVYQKDGEITSEMASARYRVILPAIQISRRGHQVEIRSVPPSGWTPALAAEITADCVVLSKSFHESNELLVDNLRGRGIRVLLDLCDNHFEDPRLGPHLKKLISTVSGIIASTAKMAEVIKEHTGKDSIVIGDPVEGSRSEPAFEPRFPFLKTLWFGHPSNLESLMRIIPELERFSGAIPISLKVVTSLVKGLEEKLQRITQNCAGRLKIELAPWSIEATWKALSETNIVLIPSLENEKKSVKSPNRLVESLWAGRFVVAHPIPAYGLFDDAAWVGNSITEGIRFALDNPEQVVKRITKGQQRVSSHLSSYHIGQLWLQTFGDITPRPLMLNLGCGDKILPEYVNVDVVESRKGMRPDVICDLHDLVPFADDSVDEILSVHVVEHFWRWEVFDILREWVRVLKPGGKMVLECPNLQSACETFLADPVTHSREDQAGRRTMWVFYGDPAWKDPYMNHRWGYTVQSLGEIMMRAGLVNVRQEPAQFKLREPRDMRVTGIKPGAGSTPK